VPLQWRNQFWQSLEEGAGKRCSECGVDRVNYDMDHLDIMEVESPASLPSRCFGAGTASEVCQSTDANRRRIMTFGYTGVQQIKYNSVRT